MRHAVPFAFALLLRATLAQGEAPGSTPREAVQAFIELTRAGDDAAAAAYLDLGALAPEERGKEGPRLARQLKSVLDHALWVDFDALSDAPEGHEADGANTDLLGTIGAAPAAVPVTLARGPDAQWRFSRRTVAAIPRLHAAHGDGWIAERLPPTLVRTKLLDLALWQWIALALLLLAAIPLGRALTALLAALGRRLARRTDGQWDDLLIAEVHAPARVLATAALLRAGEEALALPVPAARAVGTLLTSAVLLGFTWLGLRLVRFVTATLESRVTDGETDAGRVRGLQTQLRLLRQLGTVVVAVVGGALVLMQIEVVRSVGTSLLASAGIAGIVLGFAAQRSIGTLLAGLQLSLAQPIRIGDTVIVENEWGQIEEITLTYVVVRVWDQRRLVVPITRFLEQPFQNWTKVAPELLGTVFVYADYTVPVAELRAELQRFVAGHKLWDRRACGLVVTDVTERTVQLRALVSTANASDGWDLRCAVREHLVSWLQSQAGGAYLPRTRVEAGDEKAARLGTAA